MLTVCRASPVHIYGECMNNVLMHFHLNMRANLVHHRPRGRRVRLLVTKAMYYYMNYCVLNTHSQSG